MRQKEHPLIEAIKLKKKAIREKAHPLLVKRLDSIVKERAKKSSEILLKSKSLNFNKKNLGIGDGL